MAKLNDLTTVELLRSAASETLGLGSKLDRIPMSAADRTVVNAYLGSIGARCNVAEVKVIEASRTLNTPSV